MASGFGEEEIALVARHYESVTNIHVEDALLEWDMMKTDIYVQFSDKLNDPTNTTLSWDFLLGYYNEKYAKICKLFELMLTLPASSSEVERGFNQLKIIKGDRRSTITERTLNTCLAVKLLADPIDKI